MTVHSDPRVEELAARKGAAVTELRAAEQRHERAKEGLATARAGYIRAKAEHEAGEISADLLRKASERYEAAQAELEKAQLDTEVKAEKVALLDERRRETLEDARAEVAAEIESEAAEIVRDLRASIRSLLDAHRRMAALDKRRASNHIDESKTFSEWSYYVGKPLREFSGMNRAGTRLNEYLELQSEEVTA